MSQVIVYTKDRCPQCIGAKMFLKSKGIEFEERNTSTSDEFREEALSYGFMGAPVIVAKDTTVGAFAGNDTVKLNQIHKELSEK